MSLREAVSEKAAGSLLVLLGVFAGTLFWLSQPKDPLIRPTRTRECVEWGIREKGKAWSRLLWARFLTEEEAYAERAKKDLGRGSITYTVECTKWSTAQ